MSRSPLPVRDGLNPSRIRLPRDGHWPTTAAYLRDRFADDHRRLGEKIAAGEVLVADGTEVTEQTPYLADAFVFLYRDPAPEVRVPFEIEILHRDDSLLVIDKPHFLSTMPRGIHVTESALVRLRRDLGLPDLSPIHRLDRLTAGVLVFSLRPTERGAYQQLFAHRQVTKVYEAVAPFRADLELPTTIRSRIVKNRGTPRAEEVPGEPNAETFIEILDRHEGLARYGLHPRTGRTHQLRVHLHSLGIPIVGDNFWPELRDTDRLDFSDPLQLLARSIAFTDPLTGSPREFRSRRTLAAWASAGVQDGAATPDS